jgi:hypothetical protein
MIRIPSGKIRLQIVFDKMLNVQSMAYINDLFGVLFPVGGFCHRKIIGSSDLEQINVGMGYLDNLQSALCVEGGFDADPCKNTGLVKFFKSVYSIPGESGVGFPFSRVVIVQKCQSGCEGVHVWTKKVNVSKSAGSAFCQRAEGNVVSNKGLKALSCETCIPWVVGIGCKAKQHLLNLLRVFIEIFAVFLELIKIPASFFCSLIKILSAHSEQSWDVTIFTGVTASSIRVGC